MLVPEGFGTLAPYFSVRDASAFVDFLVDGLGGVHLGSHVRDGRIGNAQVRFGTGATTSTVMICESRNDAELSALAVYLFVDDAEAALARAVAHGAMQIMAIADMPYGDRQGGVADRWGMTWWLSQRLTAEPYSFD